jgi:hypothetical protein
LKFIQISKNINENKNRKSTYSNEPALAHGFGLLVQPNHGSNPCTEAARRVVTARLTNGLPIDEVFTTTTGAP